MFTLVADVANQAVRRAMLHEIGAAILAPEYVATFLTHGKRGAPSSVDEEDGPPGFLRDIGEAAMQLLGDHAPVPHAPRAAHIHNVDDTGRSLRSPTPTDLHSGGSQQFGSTHQNETESFFFHLVKRLD